jgi:hypothetical protein
MDEVGCGLGLMLTSRLNCKRHKTVRIISLNKGRAEPISQPGWIADHGPESVQQNFLAQRLALNKRGDEKFSTRSAVFIPNELRLVGNHDVGAEITTLGDQRSKLFVGGDQERHH